MTKTKQPKPEQMWAVVNTEDKVMNEFPPRPCIYRTRSAARQRAWKEAGERVMRVEITVKRK